MTRLSHAADTREASWSLTCRWFRRLLTSKLPIEQLEGDGLKVFEAIYPMRPLLGVQNHEMLNQPGASRKRTEHADPTPRN
jgi:hypothetical protein